MKDDAPPAVDLSTPPTSYTAFKPTGHVVVAFADDDSAGRAREALHERGVRQVQQVPSQQMRLRMAEMLDLASGSAEFGHEIVAMRRFLAMAAEGYGFLIAPAADDGSARRVVDAVEPLGARAAVAVRTARDHRSAVARASPGAAVGGGSGRSSASARAARWRWVQ